MELLGVLFCLHGVIVAKNTDSEHQLAEPMFDLDQSAIAVYNSKYLFH